MSTVIRTLLFEDNKRYRESLELFFEDSDAVCLVAAYGEATDAVKLIVQHKPDVVLMDIEMPGISGLEALQQIRKKGLETKILIQTAFEDNHKIFVALCSGASGYILKSAGQEKLEEAILQVHEGGGYFSPSIATKVIGFFKNRVVVEQVDYIDLTPAELEVLKCMAEGLSYKLIEARLSKTYSAIHFHIKNIYKKLHVNSMTEAVLKALKHQLIEQRH